MLTSYLHDRKDFADLLRILADEQVLGFIGTAEYTAHKNRRFPQKDIEIPIAENEAFLLSHSGQRDAFRKRYELTRSLYYTGQPGFDSVLERIKQHIGKL